MIQSNLRALLIHPLTPEMIKYVSQLPQRFPEMFTATDKRIFMQAVRSSIKFYA